MIENGNYQLLLTVSLSSSTTKGICLVEYLYSPFFTTATSFAILQLSRETQGVTLAVTGTCLNGHNLQCLPYWTTPNLL